MMTPEIFQVMVTQYLIEWVGDPFIMDSPLDMAWDPEYARRKQAADEFTKWLEGRLFGDLE